jgi:hypothetical protein
LVLKIEKQKINMGYFKKLTKGSTELTRALLGDPKPQKKHLGELAPTNVSIGLRKEHTGDKFWTDMKDMSKQPQKNIGRHIWKPPLPNPVEPEVAQTPAAAPTRMNYIAPDESTYSTLSDLEKRAGKQEGGRVDPFAPKSYNKKRLGLAVGGEIDNFVALSDEVEQIAEMQSVASGDILSQGVMSMEELKRNSPRKKYKKGQEVADSNLGSRIVRSLKKLAEDKVFRFDMERGAEIIDEETGIGTGIHKLDYLANKGDGKAKFVMMVYKNAVALGLKHPEWVASQAAAESRYGASPIAQELNNILGIKLRKGEEGPAKMMPTKEQQTTGLEPEMANFREFTSVDESLQGYDTFLRTGVNAAGEPRYDKALKAPTGPQYIQELKNANYATNDDYVNLVTDVHNQYFGNK